MKLFIKSLNKKTKSTKKTSNDSQQSSQSSNFNQPKDLDSTYIQPKDQGSVYAQPRTLSSNTSKPANLTSSSKKKNRFVGKFRKYRKQLYFVGLMVLTLSIAMLLFKSSENSIQEAEANWFNDSWRYRIRIPINYTGSETLTEYQVLVENINTSTLVTAGKMQSDCDDIRFTAQNGEVLDYFIAGNTCNTSSTDIWLKVNEIDQGPVNVYMYYGNSSASKYQDIQKTFSYSERKTVGYVMDPNVDMLNVISLSGDNQIEHNGTTISLNYGQTDTTTFATTGTAVAQWGAIKAKGHFNADDNTDNTDLFTPVSWAGTEFYYWLRAPNGNADVDFYFLAPWLTVSDPATVTVYQGGVSAGTHSVYGATGTTANYVVTGNQNDSTRDFRISSTRPILFALRSYSAGNYSNIMPVHPATSEEWIGSGATSMIMNGSASLNYAYYRNGSASEVTGTVAANQDSTAFAGGSNYGVQAYRVRSTNAVYNFGVQQHDDGDGPLESHYYNDIREQGTIFGSAQQADYISVASTQGATCSVYDLSSTGQASLLSSQTLSSSNSQVYYYGFDTGNTTAYTGIYGWYMQCSAPVIAYYQKATVTESNLMSAVMMRQFAYPAPTVGTSASEEENNGPGGYWKLDEGSDNTCSGGTNDACDSSRNKNDGALTGATWQTASSCVSGNCLSFDGVDDNVAIPANTTYNMYQKPGYTVCGWIYPSSAGEGSAGEWWSKGNTYVRVDTLSDSTVTVSASYNLATTNATVSSSRKIPINQWSHVCVGYTDDADDEITMYINGLSAGVSTNGSGSPANDSASIAYIGGDSSNNFSGRIDDVKVYTYERTIDEIKTDYNSGIAGSGSEGGVAVGLGKYDTDGVYQEDDLIAYWPFSEGYGDTASNNTTTSSINGDLAGSGTTCPTTSSACPTWTPLSQKGFALEFDGSDDYVQVSSNANINLQSKTGYTVCGLVNPSSVGEGTGGRWWAKGSSYIRVDTLSGSNVNISASFDLATTDASHTSNFTIPLNEWSHVCVGYTDDADDEITIYINGVNAGSSTNGSGSPANDSASNLFIGGDSSNNFAGGIDEVRIYDRELTIQETRIIANDSKAIILGSLSTKSDGIETTDSQDREYCVPGDTSTCNNPLAEWKFNENTGTTYTYDSSGNNYVGTLTGSMVAGDWVQGKKGSALKFDGSNDYIAIGTGPSTVKSVSFWFKPSTSTSYVMELNGSAYIWVNAGTLTATGFTTPTVYINGKSSSTVTLNEWQYVTVSSDTNINASGLNLGKYSTNYFSGILDEVKLFDYARTQPQVSWEYNKGKPFAHYKFDECEGPVSYDSSGNNINGTYTIGSLGSQTSLGTCQSGTSTQAWNNSSSGKYSSGFNFDGTDDYIDVGDTGHSVNWISFWAKPTTTTQSIIDIDGGTRSISISSGNVTATGFASPTIYVDYLETNVFPNDGEWHYVSVYSGTSYSANNVDIGRIGSSYYSGMLDDVKLFNYIPTQIQVLMDHNKGSSVNISPQ